VYIYDLSPEFHVSSSKGSLLTGIKVEAKYSCSVFILHIPHKKIITPKSDIFFQDVTRQNSSTSCASVTPISDVCMAAMLVLLIIGSRMFASVGIMFISSFLKCVSTKLLKGNKDPISQGFSNFVTAAEPFL
jgi:hypothetical protein